MKKHSLLNSMRVDEVWQLVVKTPTSISPNESLIALLRKIIEDTRTRQVYVVDDTRKLLGVVPMNTVVERFFPFEAVAEKTLRNLFHHVRFGAKTVGDIMLKKPYYVKRDTTLSEMARILIREEINELPVVDNDLRLIGQVNMYEIIARYLQVREEEAKD